MVNHVVGAGGGDCLDSGLHRKLIYAPDQALSAVPKWRPPSDQLLRRWWTTYSWCEILLPARRDNALFFVKNTLMPRRLRALMLRIRRDAS